MDNCKSCSAPVPVGQKYCSMCVGDVDHGNDGHYARAMEEDAAREMGCDDYYFMTGDLPGDK